MKVYTIDANTKEVIGMSEEDDVKCPSCDGTVIEGKHLLISICGDESLYNVEINREE